MGPQAAAPHGALAGLIADSGELLARSLDYEETLATVARLVVPAYADWCFVEMLTGSGAIERVVIEHADPSKRPFVAEYDRRYPLDPEAPFGSAKVIRTGEPELLSEIPDGFWELAAQDPEQLRLLREVGFVSALIVPMRLRGTVIGDLALATSESGRHYAEEDVRPAQELADRCALAIDSARLHTSLREARDDLHAILEGIADAVTAQAPDGRLVYANEAAASCWPPLRATSATGSRCSTTTASRCRSTVSPAGRRWPASGRRR